MVEEQHAHPNDKEGKARFDALLEELTGIKDVHVVRTLGWYKSHARRPMILFRVSGALLIVLSVSIPLLSVTEGVWKDVVLPIVSLTIAALTGLSAFFQWQGAWQEYRQTQYALEYLLSKWELGIVEAKYRHDPQEGMEMALQVTQRLLDEARLTTEAGTREYFEKVRTPEIKAGR